MNTARERVPSVAAPAAPTVPGRAAAGATPTSSATVPVWPRGLPGPLLHDDLPQTVPCPGLARTVLRCGAPGPLLRRGLPRTVRGYRPGRPAKASVPHTHRAGAA